MSDYYANVLNQKLEESKSIYEDDKSSKKDKEAALSTIKKTEAELKNYEREAKQDEVQDIVMAGQVKMVKSKLNERAMKAMGIDLSNIFS